ncbi:MAG TPA: SEC-C domain-containing protein [Bryobacteraceae bacterium]
MASAGELLRDAAMGRAGVDRRLIQSILDGGPEAVQEVLSFARASHEAERMDLDGLLVDLFRHWNLPEALDFYIAAIRRSADDVSDELTQALLPFRERAVEPLLALYEELGEERGAEVAFLLAGMHVHDPRVLALLLDRLEFDAADGAFCLGLYGDPAARQALEKMLAEIPAEDAELRREVQYAIEQLASAPPSYESEPFDILAEYPKYELPAFEVLSEGERLELLESPDEQVRAGAAHSFFNNELDQKSRASLFRVAQSDADSKVRGRAWESLADATEDASIRDAMLAVLADSTRDIAERGGAAVGLYAVADQDNSRKALEALYEEGGVAEKSMARAKALEAMWRSLWKPYARFFAQHLNDPDKDILRQAIRGAGYFQLSAHSDKIASYFDRDDDLEDLREDALFAYALAMPGETTRGRIRGMLRKIDTLANLTASEAELVMFALDERLRLKGLDPVFAAEAADETEEEIEAPQPAPPAGKPGRNDPCPCGSGKKYKKCHGA